MPSSNSWKQAYMLKADRLVSSIGQDSGTPDLITAADIANADFRKKLKASPVSLRQPDYQGPEAKAGDERDKRIEAGGFDGFLAQTEKVANTPVIKEALNVLSTGGYATANTADNILDGIRNLRDGNLRGISDIAMAPITGIAQGINGGIAQSEEDATTWGEVIKHGTQDLGMDAENDAAKWVQGIGGFAGDVLLDPATYLTVGASAFVKGSVQGAKEASKGAKSLAEEMLKTGVKAEDDVFREGGIKGQHSTVGEVAANKNGRLSNAVIQGIKAEKDWREAVKARKAQRKAAKADTSAVTDLEEQFLGVDVPAFDKTVKANEEAINAPAVAGLRDTIADDIDLSAPADIPKAAPVIADTIPLPVADEVIPEAPSMERLMDEVIEDNTPAVKVEEPLPAPKPTEPVNELDEAVKAEPLVKAPEPTADTKRFEEMGKKLELFEPKFQTKQYRNRELIKALMEPEKLVQKIPDGDPIRVPNGSKIKNRDFISLNAEGKDTKRAQKVKKDSKTTIINRDYTTGPQQNEAKYNPFIDEEGNNLTLNNETFDNLIDPDKVDEFLAANPDHMLEVPLKGGGVVKTSFAKFMKDLENASPESVDKVLNANTHFFAKLADDELIYELDEVMADYANDFKAFHGDDPELGAAKLSVESELPDEIKQVLEDDSVLEQLYREVEVDNPNKWTSDLAKAFTALKAEHHSLSPQEILGMMRPMTDAEIKKFIKKEEDGLNVGELNILREFTGAKTREDVAEKFIEMKKEYKAYKNNQKKVTEAKQKQPTREDTINKIIDSHPVKPTEENIAQAQLDATEAAEAVVSHPDALNEAVQQSHRVQEFHLALNDVANLEPRLLEEFARGAKLRDEILNDPERILKAGAQLVKNAAHNGVKRSMEVQFADAPFLTGKEKMRTKTQDKETGGAWKPERWGSNSQIALYDSILSETLRVLPRLNGAYDAVKRRRFFMSAMKVADRELRAMGVEPFLNQVDTAGKFVVNLSIYDIFKSIEEVDGGALQKLLFGGQQNAHTLTQIQGAVESMIKLRAKGVDEEKVIRSIRSNLLNSQAKNGRPRRNDDASVGVRDPKTGALSGADGQPLGTGATRSKLDAAIKSGVPAEKAIITQGRNVNALAQVIADPRVYQKLNYNMLVNHAAHASKLGEEISELADETIQLMREMSTMGGPGAVLTKFKEIRDGLTKNFNKSDFETARLGFDAKMASLITESERYVIDTASKRSTISAQPKPTAKPKEVVKDDVPDILPNGKPSHTENGKKVHVDEPKQDVVNATHAEDAKHAETTAAKVIEEAKTVPENVIVDDVVDQTVDLMAASVTTAAYRKMHPVQALTNPALGLSENTMRAIQSGSHSIARQQAHFHETLDGHLRRYTPEQLATDFKRLQELGRDASRRANGAILVGGESDSLRELYGIIGTMFEVSAKNVFARNAVGARHFNKLAQANGMPDMWRFDPDKNAVENGHLWTEWTEIEEKGIQDFLSRMHSITVKASQEIAIAADFSMRFGQKAPGDGLVKIKWTNQKEKNASFYDLIDKNLYYPREIAGQIVAMDRLMAESRAVSLKTPFGRFIVNVFDPITNALKASQTTVRPGHWVISVIGDLMRNQIAGVNSVQPYRHSIEIMKAGKEDTSFIGKIDSAEALAKYRKSQEIATGFTATGAGKGATLHIGGKKVNVSYDTLYRIMNDVIMLPKHRGGGGVLEDRFVGEQVTNKLARGLEKATDFVTDNSKFSLNDLAAKRDNFMRISLAIDFASKRQWKNLREMKSAMEGQVTKWAPTSTDMTLFEAKYARRTMLYYTWLRGITPRMIDSAMTRPGVTTMVPKALYNVALANGLNPESIGNPFPEDDGLFPSYYYNNVLGPQWKDEFGMWGINPSSPVIEVANTFSRIKPGDPVGNVLNTGAQLTGMATPFVRMPIEGAFGAQSNGIPIQDGFQYMQDNLGGSWVGAASRASGKTWNPDGIVDRTDSAAKATPEEQAEHAKLQLFNFLSGLKLTDYKSDSAQRAAYYDQREELNAEADRLRRQQ